MDALCGPTGAASVVGVSMTPAHRRARRESVGLTVEAMAMLLGFDDARTYQRLEALPDPGKPAAARQPTVEQLARRQLNEDKVAGIFGLCEAVVETIRDVVRSSSEPVELPVAITDAYFRSREFQRRIVPYVVELDGFAETNPWFRGWRSAFTAQWWRVMAANAAVWLEGEGVVVVVSYVPDQPVPKQLRR